MKLTSRVPFPEIETTIGQERLLISQARTDERCLHDTKKIEPVPQANDQVPNRNRNCAYTYIQTDTHTHTHTHTLNSPRDGQAKPVAPEVLGQGKHAPSSSHHADTPAPRLVTATCKTLPFGSSPGGGKLQNKLTVQTQKRLEGIKCASVMSCITNRWYLAQRTLRPSRVWWVRPLKNLRLVSMKL